MLATLYFDRPRPEPAQSMPWTALSPKQEERVSQEAPQERFQKSVFVQREIAKPQPVVHAQSLRNSMMSTATQECAVACHALV